MNRVLLNGLLKERLLVSVLMVLTNCVVFAQSANEIIDKYRAYKGAEYVTYSKSELADLYKELPENDFMKILAKKGNSLKAVSIENMDTKELKKAHELINDLDEQDFAELIDESDSEGNAITIRFLEDDDKYIITDVFVYLVNKGRSAYFVYAKGIYLESDIDGIEGLFMH